MELIELLQQESPRLLKDAMGLIRRSHLEHYEQSGEDVTLRNVQSLFALTLDALRDRNLTPLMEHVDTIAEERFKAGYDLGEVQTAFNVLEEVMWNRTVRELKPEQLGEALGLISTVLGAGKDRLARTYVSLASHSRAPSLNLQRLFRGSEGT